jgi:hypothetical protein
MSSQTLLDTLQRQLTKCRTASNRLDCAYWSGTCYGSISSASVLGAFDPEQRERLELLTNNAERLRDGELRSRELAG